MLIRNAGKTCGSFVRLDYSKDILELRVAEPGISQELSHHSITEYFLRFLLFSLLLHFVIFSFKKLFDKYFFVDKKF